MAYLLLGRNGSWLYIYQYKSVINVGWAVCLFCSLCIIKTILIPCHWYTTLINMGYFIWCGHTCKHSGPNAHQLPIFYSIGGSIDNHLKGKVHKNCSSRCRAHPVFSGQGAVVWETLGPDNIKSLADELWKRFDNHKALALIPRKYLKKAKHHNQHRKLFSPSSELEDKGNSEDDAPPTELKAAPPIAGPSRTTHLSPHIPLPSGITPIHRLPGSLYDNIQEIIKSEFYQQAVTICLVEDPKQATMHQDTMKHDGWMVEVKDMLDSLHSDFKKVFPKHAFKKNRGMPSYYWEWVHFK